eukprot:gene24338-34531_t
MQRRANPRICTCHHCGRGPYRDTDDTHCKGCGTKLVYGGQYYIRWQQTMMSWVRKRGGLLDRRYQAQRRIAAIVGLHAHHSVVVGVAGLAEAREESAASQAQRGSGDVLSLLRSPAPAGGSPRRLLNEDERLS